MTIIFDGTQGITTPAETANNSVTTPVVKSGSALTLQTNGSTTAVTIDTSQNVGIGTSSPSNRLSVVTASGSDGFVSVSSPTTETAGVLVNGGTSSNKGAIVRFQKDGSTKWTMGTDSAIIGGTTDNFHLYGGGANAMLFSTNASERMRIDSSGRVTQPFQPSFKVGRSAGNVSGSGTVLIFNDIQTNIGSGYNSTTGRFTAPVTGNYFFTFSTCNAGGGYMEGNIHINGGQALNGRTTGADNNSDSYTISGVLRLSVNDYVEVIINTGTHYGGSEKICYFTGFLIG